MRLPRKRSQRRRMCLRKSDMMEASFGKNTVTARISGVSRGWSNGSVSARTFIEATKGALLCKKSLRSVA